VKDLLTEPVAGALIAVDATGRASLTELSRATGRSVSTVQRALERLVSAGVFEREASREYAFVPRAPRRALRELAAWRLGPARTDDVASAARLLARQGRGLPPATITDVAIRRAWPVAIGRIVHAYHPRRVVLFGSQARGDAEPQSDVDLLVVFDEATARQARRIGITRLLRDMPFAKDVLVAATSDLERPLPGTALAEAVHHGVTVYEH
jgi:predicted nucleotidyltransferase